MWLGQHTQPHTNLRWCGGLVNSFDLRLRPAQGLQEEGCLPLALSLKLLLLRLFGSLSQLLPCSRRQAVLKLLLSCRGRKGSKVTHGQKVCNQEKKPTQIEHFTAILQNIPFNQ